MKTTILKQTVSLFCVLACAGVSSVYAQLPDNAGNDMHVFDMQTGNPVIPAYLADATIVYDERTHMFYAFGTNDGAGGGNVYPTQMWYSSNCRDWKNRALQLPSSWTALAGTTAVWAPSFIYHPATKKYYLMYGIDCKTFVAMADSPFGPWIDANGAAPGKWMYKGYDGQFFLDDDQTMYLVTDNGFFKIMKLRFDGNGRVYIDNDDPRFAKSATDEYTGTYYYAQVEGIRNMFEASFLYKRNGLYYLMWSFEGSEKYNVRYAVSENITGPYRGLNGSMDHPILDRDDAHQITGPGHHSMFDYGGRTFIAYHRQHYPFVDSKRQTCIEEVFFNNDGSIRPIRPTHRGVEVVKGAVRYEKTNWALGKPTRVSAARGYNAAPFERRFRTTDIHDFQYDGRFAVDENYGTHWDPGVNAQQPYLIVDLEEERKIFAVETIFEFTNRRYLYRIDYLKGKDAGSLDEAEKSSAWENFADRSAWGASHSPVTDVSDTGKPVKARFVRLTLLGADVPLTADGIDMENAANGWSVFEFRIF